MSTVAIGWPRRLSWRWSRQRSRHSKLEIIVEWSARNRWRHKYVLQMAVRPPDLSKLFHSSIPKSTNATSRLESLQRAPKLFQIRPQRLNGAVSQRNWHWTIIVKWCSPANPSLNWYRSNSTRNEHSTVTLRSAYLESCALAVSILSSCFHPDFQDGKWIGSRCISLSYSHSQLDMDRCNKAVPESLADIHNDTFRGVC